MSSFCIGMYLGYNGYYYDDSDELKYTFIAILIGVGTCFGTYQLLKYNWKKKAVRAEVDGQLLDDDMLE